MQRYRRFKATLIPMLTTGTAQCSLFPKLRKLIAAIDVLHAWWHMKLFATASAAILLASGLSPALGHTIESTMTQVGVPGRIDAAIVSTIRCDGPGENGKRVYVYEYTEKGGFLSKPIGEEQPIFREASMDAAAARVCGSAFAKNSPDFKIGGFPIDREMSPQSGASLLKTILSDPDVADMVNQAAAQKGIDPRAVEIFKRAVAANANQSGEEGQDFSYELPSGFTLCRLKVSPLNMTGAGNTPPEFRIGFQPVTSTTQRVYTYAKTPRGQFGQGTSRVVVDVLVIMVRDDKRDKYVADRTCGDYDKQVSRTLGSWKDDFSPVWY